MSNFGHDRERKLADLLRDDGWFVLRSAGSLGCVDLIAMKLGHQTKFIEVKATTRSAFAGFPPADRQELLDAAAMAGATPWLVWWPKRKQPVWLAASEWP